MERKGGRGRHKTLWHQPSETQGPTSNAERRNQPRRLVAGLLAGHTLDLDAVDRIEEQSDTESCATLALERRVSHVDMAPTSWKTKRTSTKSRDKDGRKGGRETCRHELTCNMRVNWCQ